MNTEQVAKRLVDLCRLRKYEEAQNELYADDAGSIEMPNLPPNALGNAEGLDAIREKGRKFGEALETVHGSTMSDPVIAGNWFSVSSTLDATFKDRGRIEILEIYLYHVRDGKIDHEQFFYDM